MKQLTKALNRYFASAKPRRTVDPDYTQFRKAAKELGVTYKLARDGFIELSNGDIIPHYTWQESLQSINMILEASKQCPPLHLLP